MFRVMKINGPEWWIIVIGCFAAICNGGVQPAYAILFSEILGVITFMFIEIAG